MSKKRLSCINTSFVVEENKSSFLEEQLTYVIRSKFFFNLSNQHRMEIKRFYEYLEQDPMFSVLNGNGSNKKNLMNTAKQILQKQFTLNNQGNVIVGVIVKDDLPFILNQYIFNDSDLLNQKNYLISKKRTKLPVLNEDNYIMEFLDRHYFLTKASFVLRDELIMLIKKEVDLNLASFNKFQNDKVLKSSVDDVINQFLPFCAKQRSNVKEKASRDKLIYPNLIKKDEWLQLLRAAPNYPLLSLN